jgi:uncharacterized protein (TIGR00251 family)
MPKGSAAPSGSSMIRVKLVPRSSRNMIAGKEGETYRIKVTAPPVDGKANQALIEFIAGLLAVPKGDIEIISGATSRLKTLQIRGVSLKEMHERLGKRLEVGG